MSEPLFSVRMRASRNGTHISGAERIAGLTELSRVASELAARAMEHERGRPDSVNISMDSLAGIKIIYLPPLPVASRQAQSVEEGRRLAMSELVKAGVSEAAAVFALDAVNCGASSKGANMRGAMIVDAATGERLEPDGQRGIRARAVDYDKTSLTAITDALKSRGLDGTHLKEALALATKVACAAGAVAELCISDDPSYVTGYVASRANGYVRISPLKKDGDMMGGRAFFVDKDLFDLDAYTEYMRETPVLVSGNIIFT